MTTATISEITKDQFNVIVRADFSNGETHTYSFPASEISNQDTLKGIQTQIKETIARIDSTNTAFDSFRDIYLNKIITL